MAARSGRDASSKFANWYKENRDERNRRRREKYAQDPARQKKNRQYAKRWRQERAAGVAISREVYREINGRRTRVYSLGNISDLTGVPVSSLRTMITRGDLPEPKLGGVHRFYTAGEVTAIRKALSKLRSR